MEDYRKPGSRKINRKRIKAARQSYRNILETLARDPRPKDARAERVAEQLGDRATREGFKRAAGAVRVQIGQKNRFREGIIRSGAYLDEIKRIFRSHALPLDLAYLTHVESSFDLRAYSKFGAAGIWQFTRSTGKRFMRVEYALDERWDPIIAARAAARLLKENYEKLGSWPLAITAYNHGAAGMRRAVKKKGDYETIFKTYRSRSFKFASRNFYSEFLAARQVAKDFEKYFGKLQLEKPATLHKVALKGFVDIADLADHYGIDLETIRQLNPALRKPVFRGEKLIPKSYTLNLPGGLTAVQAVHPGDIPIEFYRQRQKPSRFHTVRRGDTAGKIARIHGVRISDLIAVNNLDRRATIYVNQNLRLPLAAGTPGKPPRFNRKVSRKAISKTQKKEPVLASATPEPLGEPMQEPAQSIAERDEGSKALEEDPHLNPSVVTGHLKVEQVAAAQGRAVGIIRAEVEETLGHYAEWSGVRARDLRRLNGLSFRQPIHTHQPIKIPLDKVTREAFEEQRFEYHMRIQEDFFSAYRVEHTTPYHIEAGDNIWTLSMDQFKVPFWLMRKCNPNVDLNRLELAQQINIPVVEPFTR